MTTRLTKHASYAILHAAMAKDPGFASLQSRYHSCRTITCGNLWGSSKALLIAGFIRQFSGRHLLVCTSRQQMSHLAEDLRSCAVETRAFPYLEESDQDENPHDTDGYAQRFRIVQDLTANRKQDHQTVIISSWYALQQGIPDPSALLRNAIKLAHKQHIDMETLCASLGHAGYEHTPLIQYPGEFSRRGGILDVFPPSEVHPIRIEFCADVIESIRAFDVSTQLTRKEIAECTISTQLRIAGPSGQTSLLDILPADVTIWLIDAARPRTRAAGATFDDATTALCAADRVRRRLPNRSIFLHTEPLGGADLNIGSVNMPASGWSHVASYLLDLHAQGFALILVCENDAEIKRLQQLLQTTETAFHPYVARSSMHQGFRLVAGKCIAIAYHELFHKQRVRRTRQAQHHAEPTVDLHTIQRGDHVVHQGHGIGIYHGLETIRGQHGFDEYLAIEFKDKTMLYVPSMQISLVHRYCSASEHKPPLSKIGGGQWHRTKQKVQRAIVDIAEDLLKIQALRNSRGGFAFPKTDELQEAFEQAFPYTETPDQVAVMEKIREDMESPKPMDRLLCGDVGYGKTEIAMRAAFKAVMGGKQVAVLVPTTILAQQHYQSFKERMADFPVHVDVISRFRSRHDQHAILQRARSGRLDILIGTHRLLQRDVQFDDLGLVIIDEEQRFGVKHKEILKKMRATVDILTMTATPIPRTLHMSLLGIRDISSLETPPQDRLAIKTRVLPFHPQRIKQAILREIHRDGQIFFVHNRVHNIDALAERLRKLCPEARFAVAHGQMPTAALQKVMTDFIKHRYDVLVSTTIIESGLDIPNVNTIIINHANRFGLAALHQLRGRVGRHIHRAYAYMLTAPQAGMTDISLKRLKAIEEYSRLGSGFRIAMRDLEIRGAGNILGLQQSGHIAAVGYALYCRFLEQAVRRMKGRQASPDPPVEVQLQWEASIPHSYVSHETQRLAIYRKLSLVRKASEADALSREMRDRYGAPPEQVLRLLDICKIICLARRAGIEKIRRESDAILLYPKSHGIQPASGITVPPPDPILLPLADGCTRQDEKRWLMQLLTQCRREPISESRRRGPRTLVEAPGAFG